VRTRLQGQAQLLHALLRANNRCSTPYSAAAARRNMPRCQTVVHGLLWGRTAASNALNTAQAACRADRTSVEKLIGPAAP
jgi:hypothetical protein